ncbi:recombination and repair protein RecT, partial [Haemophilus influenzae]
NGIKNRN